MDANQTSAMFNDIGTKIFWGEALTTEDYTNILGFLESRRQQIAAEFEQIVPRFSEPFKDFTRKSEPFLSATGMRILDRGAEICSKILAALAWLWEKAKQLLC